MKVVYHVWSKNRLRSWMTYSTMAFAWISGFVHMNALAFSTSDVVDGVCYAYVMWESRVAEMCYGSFSFLFNFVFILIIFLFCYWRILIAIRRQAQVMTGHGTTVPSTARTLSQHIQTNIIKTMIIVSAFFAISDLPINVYVLAIHIIDNFTILEGSYYSTLFVFFLYFCANPFIYAVKFEPVKRMLLRLIPCKKTAVQPIESIDIALPAN